MKKYLSKKDVYAIFKEEILPSIPKHDIPAKCEAWNNFVDSLERDGKVNENRSRNWLNPF